MGENSFAPPILFLRGLFRHEMPLKFSVSVPMNVFSLKYRAKRDKTNEISRITHEITAF